MLLSNCGCSCNQAVAPLPPTNDTCRTLSTVTLGSLVYLQGLDSNLCQRFQALADAVGLRDCAGDRIDLSTPIVTCNAFQDRLCEALVLLSDGGEIVFGQTQLVGADCKLYTVPTSGGSETPNTVTDSSSVDLTASGTLGRDISASVKLSDDAGQIIESRPDGLYATFNPDPPVSACDQIQAFPFEGDAEPGTVLVGSDCRLYTFPASESLTVIDSDTVDLTLTGNQLAAAVKLDPDTGNILYATPDGLELLCSDVLACAPPVTVTDTPTLNLTVTGQDIQGAVKISADAGNDLEAHGDGLYVSVCEALAEAPGPSTAVPGVTELIGADCAKYTLPTGTTLQVQDTGTVNLSWDGTTLQADVLVQPSTLLSTGPQGLQVTCEAVQDCVFGIANNFWSYNDVANQVLFNPSSDTGNKLVTGSDGRPFVGPDPLSVEDTQCINLALVDNVLSATPILNPLPGNALVCDGDGLFVPEQSVDVAGLVTQCINVTVGEPTPDNFEVSAVPILSTDPGNVLECRPTGLYAPGNTIADVIGQDTDCMDVTVVQAPAGVFTLSVDPIISTGAGNQITCESDGLFVPGFQTVTFKALTAAEVIDPSDPFDVYHNSIASNMVSLLAPAPGDRNSIWIKNLEVTDLIVTSVDLIDGVAAITLDGTVPAGYPFGNNGGEAVHLVYDAALATWLIL
jgi:hypothetical protein